MSLPNHLRNRAHPTASAISQASKSKGSQVSATPKPDVLRHPIRMLRLAQVIERTGLGKTKIYELQNLEQFPFRVKVTETSVRWIESEVDAWLDGRAQNRVARQRRRVAFAPKLDD